MWRRPGEDWRAARAEPLSGDTGYFWFTSGDNVEAIVKVLDACNTQFESFWVFAGGLTNLETRLRVIDTHTDLVREYPNPQGRPFQPILDTRAFETCP